MEELSTIIFNKLKLEKEFDEYLKCKDGSDEENLKPIKLILFNFMIREDTLKLFSEYDALLDLPGRVLKRILELCIEFHQTKSKPEYLLKEMVKEYLTFQDINKNCLNRRVDFIMDGINREKMEIEEALKDLK